jgi:hypothetical protein
MFSHGPEVLRRHGEVVERLPEPMADDRIRIVQNRVSGQTCSVKTACHVPCSIRLTHPLAAYLAAYLADCRAHHKTGAVTPETSYYGPLQTLLNTVGQKLKKPRVTCFMSLKNTDGNMPDGGLFTPDQISMGDADPLRATKPARGVIEAKPLKDDLVRIAVGLGRGNQRPHVLAPGQ